MKNHPRNPVRRLTLKSSMYIDYCWLRNRWQNLGPGTQKSSKKPSSTADADIFCAHGLLLAQIPLTRTRTLGRKNHQRSHVLRLTLTSCAHIDYCWLRNCWRKLSPCCPKNHTRNLVLRLMLKSSLYIDYCCLINRWRELGPWDAKIIHEAKFYGWQWCLLRT